MAAQAGIAMTHRRPADPRCAPPYGMTSHTHSHHNSRRVPSSTSIDIDYVPPRKMPRRSVSPLAVDMEDARHHSSSTNSARHPAHPGQTRTQMAVSSEQHTGSGSGSNSGSHDKKADKKRAMFPKEVTAILREWLMNNLQHPFPTEDQKRELMARTGLTLLQINNWFINARRRTVQPLIDEQTRRYLQSREYSALSHFHHHPHAHPHHPHHQPPPLALPRLSAPPGVHGDYGVVATGGGWLQGVHFEPQSPSAAGTAASGPVVLHHPTAVVAQHGRHQQQGMVLAGPLQPANLVDSHPDLSSLLPTPPSLASNPPLSPMTVPGYHVSPASIHQTLVTHSPTLTSRSTAAQFQAPRGSTYHLQPAAAGAHTSCGADGGGILVPSAAGPQTILTSHLGTSGPPQASSQISPLTTPPSSGPTFYAFNHATATHPHVHGHGQ